MLNSKRNIHKNFCWLLLLIVAPLLAFYSFTCHAAVAEQEPTGVTVFADLNIKDKYGAVVRMDMGQLNFNELAHLSIVAPDGTNLLNQEEQLIRAVIVIPKSVDEKSAASFIGAVQSRVSKRFTKANIVFEVVKIDVGAVAKQVELSNASIAAAEEVLSESDAQIGTKLAKAMQDANSRTLSHLRHWRESFSANAKSLVKNPESVSFLYGSLVGAASSIGPVILWMSTTGGVYGVAQSLTSIVTDQINTTFSTKLVKWETEHQFPLFRDNPIVRLYNSQVFLRAITVNNVVSSATGMVYRTFSWLNSPESVSSPLSFEFLSGLAGMNLISSALTGVTDVSVRTLRKKGYVSQRSELLINSAFNFLAQMNNVFLGSGMNELLMYGLAVEWSAKAGISVLGRALPTQANKFVLIHPEVSDGEMRAIKYIHDLQEAAKIQDLTLEELRHAMQKAKAKTSLSKLEQLSRAVNSMYRKLEYKFTKMYKNSCDFLSWRR